MSTRRSSGHQVAVDRKLPEKGYSHAFSRVASRIADFSGRPWAFMTALLVILVWAINRGNGKS